MRIVILNGSPKVDKKSITMKYIFYIQKLFPQYIYKIINIGSLFINLKIRDITFKRILDELNSSDGIIWSFPVYSMLIPSQLKKFIELLFENNSQNILKDKYSISLSTSMNIWDYTAHNYMHSIIEDLGMKFVGFHSHNLSDLLNTEKRKSLQSFFKHFINCIEQKIPISKKYHYLKRREFIYLPKKVPFDKKIENSIKKVIILTDNIDKESNLEKMIRRFIDSFKICHNIIKIINLHEINIKAGCLGCFKCAYDNKCIHKDDFEELFEVNIKNTDILVYATSITDRSYSSKWQQYVNRIFYNGHTPHLEGTQVLFLISGPLNQIENLRNVISASVEVNFGNLIDIIADDIGNSGDIDETLYYAAKNAFNFSKIGYIKPPTFNKVGGYKIFRDMIYGPPGLIFRADYKFFKERKMFDFPNKQRISKLLGLFIGFSLKSKKIRKKFSNNMEDYIGKPYEKILRDAKREKELILEL